MDTRRVAYFDCATGASGDMILGALVDAGVPPARLRAALRGLPAKGYGLKVRGVRKHGIRATKVDVVVAPVGGHPHVPHVGLDAIRRLLRRSRIAPAVRTRAARVFEALGREEARIHGIPIEEVHFHEVGAVDAIVDVVGALLALDLLGVEEVFVSPLPMSHGSVRCAHGVLPAPAPAALELLRGAPFFSTDLRGELVTPTAAAIFAAECARIGVFPAMTLERVGYGAGTRDLPDRPNVLRVLIGRAAATADPTMPPRERMWMVEASLDDATGEVVGHAFDRLLEAGALDVHATPVQMKKGRPGIVLAALAPEPALAAVEEAFLRETTTFGVRRHAVERSVLPRERVAVKTRYGTVRVKIGRLGGVVVSAHPEYEDCRRLAKNKHVPMRVVAAAALAKFSSAPEKP